jgi:hypothetical protein
VEWSAVAWPTLRQSAAGLEPTPNLAEYDSFRRAFRWDKARAEPDGLPGGGLNITYEAVDPARAIGAGSARPIGATS